MQTRCQSEEEAEPCPRHFFQTQLLDSVGQAVIATDLAGTITYWNRAAEDLYGWASDEVLGRHVNDVIPTDASREQADEIMVSLRAGARWEGEFPVRRRDGSAFPAHVTTTPIYDERGEIVGIVGVSSDVSVQQDTVRRLAFEKERLQSVFEHAPAFLCVLRGPEHVFEMANPAYYEHVGRRDLVGLAVREALPEIEAQGFIDLLDRVYRTGEAFIGEEMPIRLQETPEAELQRRFVNFVYQPLKDVDGATTGVLVHGVDVTGQVEARELVHRAARANQAVMDHSLDVICALDREGRFVQVSAACERTWGYAPAELLGRNYREIVYAEDVERTEAIDRSVRLGADVTHFENRYVHKDGGLVDMLWSSTWSEEDQRTFAVGRDVSEEKHKERALAARDTALKRNEQRFRSLVEATAQVVWRADEAGNVTELSDSWEAYTGLGADDLIGWGWTGALHPDDHDRAVGAWREHLARKTPLEIEYRIRFRDGSYRWMSARKVPVFDPDGTFVEWVGTCSDIDDREQVKAALRASEARYRAIVDTASEGVWLIDPEARTTFANARMAQMLGYTPEEMHGCPIFDFADDEAAADLAARFEQRRRGVSETYDVRLRRRDGSEIWALISASPFYDEAGAFAGSLGMVTDITERKRAEEEVARSQAQYERLMYHLDGIVWEGVVNVRTGEIAFSFVSERLRNILGYDPQQWVEDASRWVAAIHEEDRPWAPAMCMSATRAGEDHAMEYRMVAADGQIVWLRDVVRVMEQQGEITTLAGIMLDVTESKRAEAALREAKERAEDMVRLKSAFLSNMSHEIRTPLTGIIGFADLLVGEATGGVQELAELIRAGGERLLLTLDSVLDLAQLESGAMLLAPEAIDVVEQARGLLRMLEPQARRRGLYLRLEPAAPHLRATADPGALLRVLTNLVNNGLKFTHRGGVTVRVGTENGHVRIEVADTGIGIDDAFLPRLFDDFEQESNGLSRNYEGVGLGLSITRRLLDLMDGTIEVESTKHAGTTFTVRFPVGPADASPAADGQTPVGEEQPAPAKPSVLVVEDRADALLIFKRMFPTAYDLTLVSTGEEALAAADRTRFDLVVMDLNLGSEMTGEQTLRELRLRPAYADVPVVACTAYALPGDSERLLELGFDAYISKPFRKEELLQAIGTLLPVEAGDV